MIAKVCDHESRRDSWFENRLVERKHPILTKLGAFYNNLPKIHPVLYNLGFLVSDENPPIAIPNFVKKCPKRQAHNYMYHIPCQCEKPPCHLNVPHSPGN